MGNCRGDYFEQILGNLANLSSCTKRWRLKIAPAQFGYMIHVQNLHGVLNAAHHADLQKIDGTK